MHENRMKINFKSNKAMKKITLHYLRRSHKPTFANDFSIWLIQSCSASLFRIMIYELFLVHMNTMNHFYVAEQLM